MLPITVTKLQVGLLSSARHIKSELNTLAERADTSRPEGLQMVLQVSACKQGSGHLQPPVLLLQLVAWDTQS